MCAKVPINRYFRGPIIIKVVKYSRDHLNQLVVSPRGKEAGGVALIVSSKSLLFRSCWVLNISRKTSNTILPAV